MKTIQIKKPSPMIPSTNIDNVEFSIDAEFTVIDIIRKDAWKIGSSISVENVLNGVDMILQATGYVKSFDIKTNVKKNDESIKINSMTDVTVKVSLVVEETPKYMSKAYKLFEAFFAEMFNEISDGHVLVNPISIAVK